MRIRDNTKMTITIEKKLQIMLAMTKVLETLGTLLFALAVYAKFGADGEPFHPMLDDELNVLVLFIVGVGMVVCGAIGKIKINKQLAKLDRDNKA